MSRVHLRLFVILHVVHLIAAMFNVSTGYNTNVVQQSLIGDKPWCFYPAAGQTKLTSCAGGNFAMVSLVHLNTTTSIGYYAPDNSRYGGAEWPIPPENPGRVTLCVSGRAQDGTYLTACMFVTADNTLPMSNPDGCWIAVGQTQVDDGCYLPGQLALSSSVATASPTSLGQVATPGSGKATSAKVGTTGIGATGTPSQTPIPNLSTSYRLGCEGHFNLLAIAALAVSVVANAIS